MTIQELAAAISRATPEQIMQTMEALPTEALEWAVRFECLGNPTSDRGAR